MEKTRKKKRSICIITGSRADYGQSVQLMRSVQEDVECKLQLVVTGMHLVPELGSTYKIIEQDGFAIDKKFDMIKFGTTANGTTKAIGLGCQLFADAFDALKPDIVVLFGDRFEMLSACIAAYVAQIPIAHVHGGETSQGVIDEGIRHSITKMAHIHFAATEEYRQRIIRMGEQPSKVFNFGAPGQDYLRKSKFFKKEDLEKELDFHFGDKIAIATYHPVTLERVNPSNRVREILNAIEQLDMQVIFTKANSDPGGEVINDEIESFCEKRPDKYRLYPNLGSKKYFSCLKYCDVMIGNSSSGIVEAPTFRLPVINVGDRQKGRIKAKNIIDVKDQKDHIVRGIKKGLSPDFRKKVRDVRNPYARFSDGKISFRVKEVLKKIKLNEQLIIKSFYDA